MDLQKSSPPSPVTAVFRAVTPAAATIPAPRRPSAQPAGGPNFASLTTTAPSATPTGLTWAARLAHCLNLAEGALVLMGVYVLIGAGIGEAAGSVLVGVAAGLIAGVCAIAAILLITGSARAASAATDRFPRRLPHTR